MSGQKKQEIENDEQLEFLVEASEADSFEDSDYVVPEAGEKGEESSSSLSSATNKSSTSPPEGEEGEEELYSESDGSSKQVTPDPAVKVTEEKSAPEASSSLVSSPSAEEVKAQPELPAETPPVETSPDPSASSSDQLVETYNAWRKESEALLAEHHYKLPHELAEELELDPVKAIPKLMSKVYLDAVSAAIGQVTTHLPRMVRLVNEQEQANQESENAFFTAWPDLKAHKDDVIKIGQAYRAQNPHASAEDFINNVGAMTMVALKKPIPGHTSNLQSVSSPAFVPAAQTPVGGIPPKAKSTNIFSQLDNEMFEEDADLF